MAAIVAAAEGVFFRYGFKKASMDDLARAAGLSRQGLYLHFPTKEALFKETVARSMARLRQAQRDALARKDASIEERLLDSFSVFFGLQSDNLEELLAAAKDLVGPAMDAVEAELTADIARALRAADVPARWKEDGFTAKNLAEQLMAASHGIKHQTKVPKELAARMQIAIRLVCRGDSR